MKGAHQKQFRCLFPTCTHRKSVKPSFRLSPQSFRKVVRPPFDILNYTQKQGGTQTNRGNTLTLKKAHHAQTVTKIEGSDIQLIPQFLSLHFSQHIPLTKSHSPSMLRERLQERGYRRCARNPQKKNVSSLLAPPPLLQTGLLGQPYFHTSLSSGEESSCGDRSRHMLSPFRLGCRARVQPPSNSSK